MKNEKKKKIIKERMVQDAERLSWPQKQQQEKKKK